MMIMMPSMNVRWPVFRARCSELRTPRLVGGSATNATEVVECGRRVGQGGHFIAQLRLWRPLEGRLRDQRERVRAII